MSLCSSQTRLLRQTVLYFVLKISSPFWVHSLRLLISNFLYPLLHPTPPYPLILPSNVVSSTLYFCVSLNALKELPLHYIVSVSYTHLDVYKRQISHCTRQVPLDFTVPVFYRDPSENLWLYSLPQPTRVTWNCPANNTVRTEVIEGTGILNNTMYWYLHSDSFELFPYTHGQTKMTLEPEHVVIPEFPTTLTDQEQKVFQNYNQTNQFKDLEGCLLYTSRCV